MSLSDPHMFIDPKTDPHMFIDPDTKSTSGHPNILRFTDTSLRMYQSKYVECVLEHIFSKQRLRIHAYRTNISMANDIYICIV